MSIFTTIWNLLKKDMSTEGTHTFNIQTMLNDNWDKIDVALGLKSGNADVRVATTAIITLSGLQTIDGISLAAGNRVLVKNQSTGSQNGIYTVVSGAWSRTVDADTSAKFSAGMFVYVEEGAANAGTGWVMSNIGTVTIGTTALTFVQKTGPGSATDAVIGNRTLNDAISIGTVDTDTPTNLLSKISAMLRAITGKADWYTAPAVTLDATNTHLNATAEGTHGSTAAATANRIVHRDTSGRSQFIDPLAAADAATKNYVDTTEQGRPLKDDVRVATTANITLSGSQTIDTIAVVAGDRVLVKNQTAGAENGIYVVAAATWTRAVDFDSSIDIVGGSEVYSKQGTLNGGTIWRLTNIGALILGTTALTFGLMSGPGSATDVVIGSRTITDTLPATTGADTPTNLLSKLGNMIKGVTGTANWYTLPSMTISSIITALGLKAPLESPALTGIPTVPTATAENNTVQAASTAFVGTAITNHASLTSHIPYVAVTGPANTYVATLTPALVAYVAGVGLSVLINVANTGAATININGLGAKAILDSKGNAMTSGKLKLNSIYTLRYNGTAFILQGEGGGGDATAANLLVGKTATVDSGDIEGTMPNKAATGFTPGAVAVPIPEGYYSGQGSVAAVTNLLAANILASKTVGSVVGSATSDANALAAEILSGKTAYVNGVKLSGTLIAGVPLAYGNGTTVTPNLTGIYQRNHSWSFNPQLSFTPRFIVVSLNYASGSADFTSVYTQLVSVIWSAAGGYYGATERRDNINANSSYSNGSNSLTLSYGFPSTPTANLIQLSASLSSSQNNYQIPTNQTWSYNWLAIG